VHLADPISSDVELRIVYVHSSEVTDIDVDNIIKPIADALSSVVYDDDCQITDVRWIRLGSVTHAFDMSARANTLSFEISDGNVEVRAPNGPNLAPPGHYLLFILNRNGVPSVGKVVRVQ
jgi:hypothetical protein